MTGPVARLSPAAATAQADGANDRAKLQKVAKQFEAVFMRQMIGSMRQAGLADGALDSSATEQFRDMADARTADSMAEKGGFGVADLLMRQFAARAAPSPVAKALTPPAVDSSE